MTADTCAIVTRTVAGEDCVGERGDEGEDAAGKGVEEEGDEGEDGDVGEGGDAGEGERVDESGGEDRPPAARSIDRLNAKSSRRAVAFSERRNGVRTC